jgi:hypothetical protein
LFALSFKKARGANAMVEETTNFIKIDLNQFKLHLYLKQEAELTLHFDTPSRRFYLSVIGTRQNHIHTPSGTTRRARIAQQNSWSISRIIKKGAFASQSL